jgi:hypothetical protein
MLEKPRLKDCQNELPEIQVLNMYVLFVKIKIGMHWIYGQVTSVRLQLHFILLLPARVLMQYHKPF